MGTSNADPVLANIGRLQVDPRTLPIRKPGCAIPLRRFNPLAAFLHHLVQQATTLIPRSSVHLHFREVGIHSAHRRAKYLEEFVI